MNEELKELKELLHTCGEKVHAGKTLISVVSRACIDKNVPDKPGVYWIETTMPAEEMRQAISVVRKKEKKLRKTRPPGAAFIIQSAGQSYVAYSGTEEDLRERLKQHLFNEGHQRTEKLGCEIDKEPFSNYKWRVGFARIDSYELRYAIEAWWRINLGWPLFCLR